jgi:hypothetical protein
MFIKLTQVNQDHSTSPIFINTEHVICFEDNLITLTKLTSTLVMNELIVINKTIAVVESSREIIAKLVPSR